MRQVSVRQPPGVVMSKVPLLHEALLVTTGQAQVNLTHHEGETEVSVRPAQQVDLNMREELTEVSDGTSPLNHTST